MSTRSERRGPSPPAEGSPPAEAPPRPPSSGGGSRVLAVEVHLLDDTVSSFNVQYKAVGRVLFEQVCRVINLLEVDYFGLEYADSTGTKYWLDYEKPMCRQMGLSMVAPVMDFCVKFYTPDPAQLEEEFTRYLFSLQIKRDLSLGILQCSDPTAALLASYIVQASCGDYVPEDYPDHSYLSTYKFVPHQNKELEIKIMDNHKKHVGQSPAESDLNLLETARRCELYGIRMTAAKDNDGLPLNLSVAHMGVIVFQNTTKINTFSWAKIRKLSFKRRKFLIKLHPEGYGYYKETVEFFFESRNECKNFWKKCIENHAFFRCTEVKKTPRQKTRLFSRGSSFRYSGRTQKQIVEYVRENYVKRQPFQRSTSLRLPSRSSVGTSDDEEAERAPAAEASASTTPAALSEPSSPRREAGRETTAPRAPTEAGGAVTPSQDTDDNVSHDSYRLEEGDSSLAAAPPGSPIAIDLHSPPPPPSPSSTRERAPHRAENGIGVVAQRGQQLRLSDDVSATSGIGQSSPPQDHGRDTTMGDLSSSASRLDSSASDVRRKKYPCEKAYFIAKELLMAERTYKKDLEVVVMWFRERMEKGHVEGAPTETLSLLFSLLAPLYKLHCCLLLDLEQRLAAWEGKPIPTSYSNVQGIGGLLLDYLHMVELYERYMDKLPRVLERLWSSCCHGGAFEDAYRDFELQGECYLPLAAFLLHPVHRPLQLCGLVERLHGSYESNHSDKNSCSDVLHKLKRFTNSHKEATHKLENQVKMMELQRDLTGLDNLVQPGREFVREGCLQKLSRKGYQQRMFFLFSDVLIYASRTSGPRLQFKVHGQLPLQSLMVEETEPKVEAAFRFTIYAGNRALMVAAGSEEERQRWMKDLSDCIELARDHKDTGLFYSSLKSCNSSDERLDRAPQESPAGGKWTGQPAQHSNTALHLCWHRNTSIGRQQHQQAFLHYLSGYLLRKFKNSSGWQKLWVVFTNFCLFFYKSFQESAPLASLPLLGYTVTVPGPDDNMSKEFVFKLQYRNHVYFFRAESEYAFDRWMEVISSAAVKKLN
ncbi:FERM, ARHGEF and pleckstrin domain-containing protein 2-like [Ixodes scapularis]|uniref:FERM, ARHGEF and pleckstrin domain-containing protein 2-like n=1 Tax=Ixodes scapularis TaxID=6945 RepID=UPI001C384C88|nr:FERM, ARHGEF and pleckstrin domain-containing protein 2-like [Ixodes scapularis]